MDSSLSARGHDDRKFIQPNLASEFTHLHNSNTLHQCSQYCWVKTSSFARHQHAQHSKMYMKISLMHVNLHDMHQHKILPTSFVVVRLNLKPQARKCYHVNLHALRFDHCLHSLLSLSSLQLFDHLHPRYMEENESLKRVKTSTSGTTLCQTNTRRFVAFSCLSLPGPALSSLTYFFSPCIFVFIVC